MHVLAAILDPSDNGFDIADLSVLVAILATLIGAWVGTDKWLDKRRDVKRAEARDQLKAQIAEIVQTATAPIQSDANGNSINARVNLVIERQTDVIRDLRAVRERLDDHIDTHNRKD